MMRILSLVLCFLCASQAAYASNSTDSDRIYHVQLILNPEGAAIAGGLYLGVGTLLMIPAITAMVRIRSHLQSQTPPDLQGFMLNSPIGIRRGVFTSVSTTVGTAALIQCINRFVDAFWAHRVNPQKAKAVMPMN